MESLGQTVIQNYYDTLFHMFKGYGRNLGFHKQINDPTTCKDLYHESLCKMFKSDIGNDIIARFNGIIIENEIPAHLRKYIWEVFRSVLSDYVKTAHFKNYDHSSSFDSVNDIFLCDVQIGHIDNSYDPKLEKTAKKIFSELKPEKIILLSYRIIKEESLQTIAERFRTNPERIRQAVKRNMIGIQKKIKKIIPNISENEIRQVWDIMEGYLKEWCDDNDK